MTENGKSKLWKHIAALIYDIFPILGIFLVTSLIFVLFRSGDEVKPNTLWFQLILLTQAFLYFSYSWKKGGQTLGMRAWKIGIKNHQFLTWKHVTLRFAVGIFSICLFGLGLWWRLWDSQNQTWMDKACGQPVVELNNSAI
jgi:uncharacterized RDD family membrane protein YckC